MIIFVLIGSLFLIASAIAFVNDAMGAIDAGHLSLTPLGKVWFDLDPSSLNLSQAIIQRYTLPEIWDPAIVTILNWPAIFVFAALGVFFIIVAGIFRARSRAHT